MRYPCHEAHSNEPHVAEFPSRRRVSIKISEVKNLLLMDEWMFSFA